MSVRSGRSSSLLSDTRVHEYELAPRGLTTTMVGADGTARKIQGPTALYERRPSLVLSENVSEFLRQRSQTPKRESLRAKRDSPSRNSAIYPSSSLSNLNLYSGGGKIGGTQLRIPKVRITAPKPLPPKPQPYEMPTEVSAGPSAYKSSSAASIISSYSFETSPAGKTGGGGGGLPPLPPKQVKHHYPLPPPSFPDAMVSVSKRLRNRRSVSPTPQYAQLQLGSRPGLVNAALGRDSPSKETLRMLYTGPKVSNAYSVQTRNL